MSAYASVTVVPYRYWYHEASGRKASVFGAAPCWGDPASQGWVMVEKGWTYRCVSRSGNVTYGACRKPAETLEEAESVAAMLAA